VRAARWGGQDVRAARWGGLNAMAARWGGLKAVAARWGGLRAGLGWRKAVGWIPGCPGDGRMTRAAGTSLSVQAKY